MKPILHRRRTLRDVAKAAGVSLSTASNALNATGRVNRQTRETVLQIATEIGFMPNALARGLLSRRSFTIGMLTNDTYGRLTLPMMAGVSESLVDHGISVFLCATNNDPRRAQLHLQALLARQVDGIIITGTRRDLTPAVELSGLPVPVVYAFAEGPAQTISFVPDDAHGARLAVEHLRSLGRSRIVHITGPMDYLAARIRAAAYRQICGDASEVRYGAWTEEWGYEATQAIFSRAGDRPDAIFCGSDEIARGVIDALRDLELSVPGDVAIAGYDNWEVIARQTRPPLTTVDMELKEVGRRAGLAMLALTRGEEIAPGVVELPCRLVIGRSCGG
ncbi:MAG: LacI family transcriptional regulator [Proteobacteria bacterium]|nr:LacI family transcriptional regulator [Pseudomonadota bacterium]